MNKRFIFLFTVLAILLNACGGSAPAPMVTPATAIPPTRAAQDVKLRINETTPRLGSVHVFLALDALRAQGYEIETTKFARFDLVTTALAKGELDLASGSIQTTWTAIGKGAPVKTIVGNLGNSYVFVAANEIKSCADLQGKTVGTSAANTVTAQMFKTYRAQNCPNVEFSSLILPVGESRLPALMGGQVQAAQMEIDEALELDRQAPNRFHRLVAYGQAFPDLQITGFYARREFIQQHPDVVRAFIRALIEAERQVQDKDALRAAAVKYLAPDDTQALAAIDTFHELKLWDKNGALTNENLTATLAFLQSSGALPATLTVQDVADLSYMNAVLDEIGRVP